MGLTQQGVQLRIRLIDLVIVLQVAHEGAGSSVWAARHACNALHRHHKHRERVDSFLFLLSKLHWCLGCRTCLHMLCTRTMSAVSMCTD